MSLTRLVRFAAALLIAAALPACGDDGGSSTPTVDDNGPPQGLRVFYALEQPPVVDLVLFDESDQQLRIDGIQSGRATSHQALQPGVYRMSFFTAGTDTPLNLNVADLSIEADDALTFTVAPDDNGAASPLLLQDAIALPPENQSTVRLVYLAHSPAADIVNAGDATRWADGLEFGQLAPYRSVPLGTYTLEVAEQASGATLLSTQLPLRPAQVSTLFIIGDADPDGDPTTDDSTLEAIHVVDHTFE